MLQGPRGGDAETRDVKAQSIGENADLVNLSLSLSSRDVARDCKNWTSQHWQ